MKPMKYLAIASAIMLVLTGCEKKERPTADETAPKKAEVVDVVVEERPAISCDDDTLKSRVMSLVRDNVHKTALEPLQDASNLTELEQALKTKLASLSVDVADVKEKDAECIAKLHVGLSDADIKAVDKAFVEAGLPSLAEQASELGLELSGNHLIGELIYQINGEALSVKSTNNPAIDLASSALAQAVVAQVSAQKPAPVKKETPKVATVSTPRPVQPAQPTTPAERPVRNNEVSPAQVQPRQPRAETPRQTESEPRRSETRPSVEPKPAPTPEPKPVEPKAEPKPEPSVSHKPVTDNSSEITIVESDDTY